MRYKAVFTDEFLSYFRLDDNGKTLVLTDRQGFTRAVTLEVEVEPKRGKWVSNEFLYTTRQTICSNCKTEFYVDDLLNVGEGAQEYLPNYCPHCGAQMTDAEGEE